MTNDRLIKFGEDRLDDYVKRILDFLDELELETHDTFIPFLADMAVVHAVITRLVRLYGATRGIEESEFLFADTIGKLKPVFEELEKKRGFIGKIKPEVEKLEKKRGFQK